jgi:hypothetical protein
MFFKILDSNRLVDLKIHKYLINWDKKITRGGKKNFGKFQFDVKKLLRPFWEDDIVLEEMPVPALTGQKGKSIDIVNITQGICIECDGRHHGKIGWMHKDKECLRKQLFRDDYKLRWAELNNFKMVNIYEDDILGVELLEELEIIT